MMTWNKAENTITNYNGEPMKIQSVGTPDGRVLDFAVEGLGYYIHAYSDNLRIIE